MSILSHKRLEIGILKVSLDPLLKKDSGWKDQKFHILSSSIYGKIDNGCGEGNGNPLQYSCLENPMDGGAWKAAVHGVAEGRTRLSDLTFTFHFHALEKEMATHSSVLAWRIPGTGEPGELPSMGSHRVRHDWSDLAAVAGVTLSAKWSQIMSYRCTYRHCYIVSLGRTGNPSRPGLFHNYIMVRERNS